MRSYNKKKNVIILKKIVPPCPSHTDTVYFLGNVSPKILIILCYVKVLWFWFFQVIGLSVRDGHHANDTCPWPNANTAGAHLTGFNNHSDGYIYTVKSSQSLGKEWIINLFDFYYPGIQISGIYFSQVHSKKQLILSLSFFSDHLKLI